MATVTAIAGVASAGMGILGGITGGRRAAGAQAAAQADEERAMQFQQGVYGTAGSNLQPWISGGQGALGMLESGLGVGSGNVDGGGGGGAGSGSANLQNFWNKFTTLPYYTFPLQQNLETMDRTAQAKNLSLNPGQVADLGKYAGGYAAGQFGNYMGALERLSGMGQTASTQLGQIGTQVGQQVGQTATQLGGIAIGGAAQQQGAQNQMFSGIGNLLGTASSYGGGSGGGDGSGGGLFSNQRVGDYSIPGTSMLGPYGSLFGNPAAGTGGGFNNGSDLLSAFGGVTTPPIPPI